MKRNTTSQSAFFNPRLFAAFLLCCAGVSMALLSFAATPPGGTITDTSGPLTYTAGPFVQPNSFGNTIAGECDPDPSDPLVPCDIYRLHVSLPAGWVQANPTKHLFVRIEWPTPAAVFDLYLWDANGWTAFPSGSPLASSTQTATTFQQVEVPPNAGSGDFIVQVSTTFPAGQSFTGKIFLAEGTVTGPPQPPGNASGIPPRFQEYIPTEPSGAPSASLGLFAGEPTIGINPKTGHLFYQGLLEVLRVLFDDSTSPARASWEAKDSPTGISNKATTDPIFLADPTTGRLWSTQLAGGDSLTDYSDDDGQTWLPAISGGIGTGVDHQGLGAGPYPTTGAGSLIPHPTYPNAVYYCSQQIAAAFCARSDDGGLHYGPIVPVYDSAVSRCVGLHGHPKVAPDGTVYLPNKGCGLDTPVVGNGYQNVVVSEDAGITWAIRKVPDSVGGLLAKGDPSVAIDKAGTIYLAYQNLGDSLLGGGGNGAAADHMMVAVSSNKGQTFSPSVDVGALAGITHAVFPAAVAGDAGRVAVAFFGTTYTGPESYEDMSFPGKWYLYVATSYDGGSTWFVANATPDHPIQGFGGIGNSGDNRNHYDFIDAQMDLQGRVIASNSIGCSASCVSNGGPNTFSKLAGIIRQSGGRRLLAQFDPPEPALAAAPLLSGYRTNQLVYLTWPETDNGGSPVTGYNVYRRIDAGAETKILSNTQQRQLSERTSPAHSYQYRVTAVNNLGEGASSNIFAPTVGQNAPQPGLSCTEPGQLYNDRVGEGGADANNDIASFGVSEPQSMPGKLVFTINNVQPQLTAGNDSIYTVFFDPPRGGLRYRLIYSTDGQNNGITSSKDNDFTTSTNPETGEIRNWTPVGALDPASGVQPDGRVRLVVDKTLLHISNGDVLLGVAVREDTTQNPSSVFLSDYAGGRQDYLVVGNDFCTRAPTLLGAVSRKTHGNAGTYDVSLPLVGTAGVEPRSGGLNKNYTVVFHFVNPIASVSGASVTSGTGSVSSSGVDNNDANSYFVNLTGVTSPQTIQIKLTGVSDGVSTGDVTLAMSIVLGDTNGDGTDNSADATQMRNNSGQLTDATNFRTDVNADGVINSADATIVRANSGQGITATVRSSQATEE
ncbi:MAG TPA: dockerin type I domain-containing protein [Chthoniobacterales bacterium]